MNAAKNRTDVFSLNLPAVLLAQRTFMGISRADMSRAVGMSESSLKKYEETTIPPASVLLLIADVLDLTLDDIVEMTGHEYTTHNPHSSVERWDAECDALEAAGAL